MRKIKKTGKIIPNGVRPSPQELNVILLFTNQGIEVESIPKSNQLRVHTPDIKMLGKLWEIKSPQGSGKYLIQNTLHKAVRQSANIIIDLTRIKIRQEKCFRELEKEFLLSKSIKHMKIITKQRRIIDFIK